jgi:protein-S-isoprenylcysteine O-methyltransferase Ste14
LIAWKEEKELVKEFGETYKKYKENVPMFIPKLKRRKQN